MATTNTATTKALTPAQAKRAKLIAEGKALEYSPTNYDITGPVQLVHIDKSTGAVVGNFGEGVESLALFFRSMVKTPEQLKKYPGGARFDAKVVICGAYVQKPLSEAQQAKGHVPAATWVFMPRGAFGTSQVAHPTPGVVVIDSAGVNGFAPHVDATISSLRAAYSAKLAAALASKRQAA
jgi:hypothetical protein